MTEQLEVTELVCLDDRGDGTCQGPVMLHWTGGAKSWPRCDHHQDKRMERREGSMEMYAECDVIPSWFDPSYAGERWFEDE